MRELTNICLSVSINNAPISLGRRRGQSLVNAMRLPRIIRPPETFNNEPMAHDRRGG